MDELTKILEASDALFRKYGIRSVTMADIARSLGMSKKTLYVHIENKHDLVEKIMKRYIIQDEEACFAIKAEANNALEELLKISLYVQQQIKDVNPSLIFDLQKYHRPVWEMLDAFHREGVLRIVEENLQRGIEEGLYRKDLNAALMARLHVGLMSIVSDIDLFPLDQFPTHFLHKEFIKYHIYGIVSAKGKELLNNMLDSLDPAGDFH